MNNLLINILSLGFAAAAITGQPATAAEAARDAVTQAPAATNAGGTPAAESTAAEVRKIDRDAKKITLKHEEIKSLGMPPMTMVFQVNDAAMLDGLKAGDKVKFSAEKTGGGYRVTSIQTVK